MICGYKELKKIANISRQLDTVKRVICMDNEFQADSLLVGLNSTWTVTSFSDVDKLGRENPVEPDLPLPADTAVIMYTSGSTGMPKVRMNFFMSYIYSSQYVINFVCIIIYSISSFFSDYFCHLGDPF